MTALSALVDCLDVIGDAKSDELDPFVLGVLAGVEDAIEVAQEDLSYWLGSRWSDKTPANGNGAR